MVYSDSLFAAISVPKAVGMLRHVGLLLPNGSVVHCAPQRGEHATTLEQFAVGRDVVIHLIVPPEQWAVVLTRIDDALRHPGAYHPTANNCEMFVNRMLTGQSVSPQLRGLCGLLVVATLITMVARS